MNPNLNGLRSEFERFNEEEDETFGELGNGENGKYSVFVRGNPKKMHVRLRDGTTIQALHQGKVPPSPDLPVEIGYNKFNQAFIKGTDDARIPAFTQTTNANSYQDVGFHTHHRGSGLEFPIDWILFQQFRANLSEDHTVTFSAGWLVYNSTYLYFAGEVFDCEPYLPLVNGFSRWIVFYLNPTVDPVAITYSLGTEVQTLTGLTVNSLNGIIDTSIGNIPLCAIKLKKPSTRLEHQNLESLLPVMSLGGQESTEQGVIVTYEGNVVTYNGYVLRYNLETDEAFTLEDA